MQAGELEQTLVLARRTLEFVERSRPGPGLVVLEDWKVQPRPQPSLLPSWVEAAQGEPMGTFYVRNVYQSTQTIPIGSVKSLRVVRVFPQTVESPPSRSIAVYEMPKQRERRER